MKLLGTTQENAVTRQYEGEEAVVRTANDYTVEEIPLAYAPVPAEMLLHRPKVTEAEMKVWCAFAMHRHLKEGTTFVGQQRISEIIGMDRTTVGRAVASLMEKGFLLDKGRRKDPDTGRWHSRVFQIAVDHKPVVMGLVQQRTQGNAHAAPTPRGMPDKPARQAVSHDAVHDARHAASVHPKEEKEYKEEKDISPRVVESSNEPPQQPPTETEQDQEKQEKVERRHRAKELNTETIDLVRAEEFEPTQDQRKWWGSGWAFEMRIGTPERDIGKIQEVITEQAAAGVYCSIKQAKDILKGEATPYDKHAANKKNGNGGGAPLGSPEETIEGLRQHDYLKRYVHLAKKFDFTQLEEFEQPPWPIYVNLGGDDMERSRNLQRMQSVVRSFARRKVG